MSEIIIDFRKSCNGIKLVPSDEIEENYKSRGEAVSFQWVFCQYVEIGGVSYAIVPLNGVSLDTEPEKCCRE